MKSIFVSALALVVFLPVTRGATIAQWNFNSAVPDATTSTGTLVPAIGPGTASLVGSNSDSFTSGDTSHDPAGSTDNSAWHTSGYPAATKDDTSAGVRFNVDTTGYQNVTLAWYQRNSATASRYLRLQYTLDGWTFSDADLIAVYADSVYTNQTVDLSVIDGASNNPLFAFRLLTQFESTAIGYGTNAYVATKPGSTYSTAGTINFDMVTVSGSIIPGANTAPGISSIPDLTVRVNQKSDVLDFNIWDLEDSPQYLELRKSSSDPAIVPEGKIAIVGTGAARTVEVTAASQPGASMITLCVIDTGGRSNQTSFNVTVLPANTAPFISSLSCTNTVMGLPSGPISFTVGDLETPANTLGLSASSANPALVPNTPANIRFDGSGSNRTVTLTPAPGQTGVAPITVTVSDGTNTAHSVFALNVTPSAAVVFYDPFTYPEGSLLTNSGFLWDNRSGTFGQCEVVNAQLQITNTQTEDVVAPLWGGPYAKSNSIVLYASFKVNFRSLPKLVPGYFAHFGQGTYLRGRVYASITNCWSGGFRLCLSNGSDPEPSQTAFILSTNTTYTVVVRYDIDSATTTLWVNPSAETDSGLIATDVQTAVPIGAYGFRQDSDIGATIHVDDLKVGLTFAAVVANLAVSPIPLNIQARGTQVVLSWPDSAFGLQSGAAARGPFTNIAGASSPFTNPATVPAKFFRLKSN